MTLPSYDRHPLSAQYDNLEGEAWDDFLQGVKANGVLNGRKIILHDGKILDGWQLYRACKELGTKVEFKTLPLDVDPEEFVSTVNDRRRHESQAAALARVAKRREAVAALRSEGKSLRGIASEVGVSQQQVKRDLEAVETNPGVTPVTVENPPKIVGKDGKKYKNPKKPRTKKPPQQEESVPPPTDEEGHAIPEHVRPAFAVLGLYDEAKSHAGKLRDLLDKIAKAPGGSHLARRLRTHGNDEKVAYRADELIAIFDYLKCTRPYSVCPYCTANKSKCNVCHGEGWVEKSTWNTAEESIRARLEAM